MYWAFPFSKGSLDKGCHATEQNDTLSIMAFVKMTRWKITLIETNDILQNDILQSDILKNDTQQKYNRHRHFVI
jgi:hypothetical protein